MWKINENGTLSMKQDSFKEFVQEQLGKLAGVSFRSMFGGYGIYQCRSFFGIIHKGRLYFKVSDQTKTAYAEAGMKPFKPNRKQTLRSFYEVPVDVFESQPLILSWAEDAIHSAQKT